MSSKMKQTPLKRKMILIFGLIILLIIGTVVVTSLMFGRRTADFMLASLNASETEAAKKEVVAKANAMAFHVRAEFETGMDAARMLAQVFSAAKDVLNLRISRNQADGILRSVAAKNETFKGVYSCWEPDALDNEDEEYANTGGTDETGRFISYWRSDGRRIELRALTHYENEEVRDNGLRKGAYYLLPKARKQECIIDPSPQPVADSDDLVISMVAPIKVDDYFYGIAGVDMGVAFMQSVADAESKELFSGAGSVGVVGYNGVIAAVSGKPDLQGKHMKSWLPGNWEAYLDLIRKKQQRIHVKENEIDVLIPMEIGETEMPWAVIVRLPRASALQQANKLVAEVKARSRQSLLIQVGVSLGVAVVALLIVLATAENLVTTLKRVVRGVREAASQVSSASDEIAVHSQSLADRASGQASSVEETSAALEVLNAKSRETTTLAGEVETLMKENIEKSGKSLKSIVELSKNMSRIEADNDEISGIIKTIDGIAFQTGLLALNAAVEAARAGEAGAGFAVVAEEVRNLSRQTTEAAETTQNMLTMIMQGISRSVESINSISQDFEYIIESATVMGEKTGSITGAAKEQYEGLQQIYSAESEIDTASQEVAASAEQSAASAAELTAQAEALGKYVDDLSLLIEGRVRRGRALRPPGAGARKPSQKEEKRLSKSGEEGGWKQLPEKAKEIIEGE